MKETQIHCLAKNGHFSHRKKNTPTQRFSVRCTCFSVMAVIIAVRYISDPEYMSDTNPLQVRKLNILIY